MSKNNKIKLNKTKPYFNIPIEGNAEAHRVWNTLFKENILELESTAHSLFLDGIKKLQIQEKSISKLNDLENIIKKKTGWVLTPTNTEYSTGDEWFDHFSKKSFLVTKYIRSKENLEYTPYPDSFHDIFGHLPFFTIPKYARIAHKLGIIYQKLKTKEDKQQLTNFWWYTFEFGLLKEKGELKVLGAGLMSSKGERKNAFSKNVILRPFNFEEIKNTEPSVHKFHKILFVIENLKQIEDAVNKWK
jgi:phenylalanine-4-hydroxylase